MVYRALAAALVSLLFVIMGSAVQRMQIYVGDAGTRENWSASNSSYDPEWTT